VLASFTTSPASLAFGIVSVGSSSAVKTVTITNTGPSVLPLKSVALVGTEATQFRRANSCPKNVAAGGSCTVRVRFVPTTLGVHQATLAISAGGGAGNRAVTLSGTGQ
jgi:hypothetical protein